MEEYVAAHPGMKGLILGSHGLFTWADTSYYCYSNSLEVIEKASEYIESAVKKNGKVVGGEKVKSLDPEVRKSRASRLIPVLRGLCSAENRMIGHFSDAARVLEFIVSSDLGRQIGRAHV